MAETWVVNTAGKSSAAPLGGDEVLRVIVDGASGKATVDDIKTFVFANGVHVSGLGQGDYGGYPALAALVSTDDETWNLVFRNEDAGDGGWAGIYMLEDGDLNIGHVDYDTQLTLWRTGSYYDQLGGGGGAFVAGSFTAWYYQGGYQMNYSGPHNRLGVGVEIASHTIGAEGNIGPETDDAYSLGTSSLRWSTVYATTGAINTSDARLKTDIADCQLGLAFIERLRPVAYRWIDGGREAEITGGELLRDEAGRITGKTPLEKAVTGKAGKRLHHGLIAQEVKAALDDVVAGDFAGWVLEDKDDPTSKQSLRYDQFIAPLIKAVQELTTRVQVLEKELAGARGR